MGVKTKPLVLGTSIYPAALGGTAINDWTPTGLSTAGVIYVTGTVGTTTLTGLSAGADGDLLLLVIRDSGSTIAIAQESGGSLAANRFNFALTFSFSRGGVLLRYDGTLLRWTRVWAATA